MPLITISDRKAWDAFMGSRPNAQFTQSWAWGEFRIAQKQQIRRLALADVKGNWLAAGLFIRVEKAGFGGYWYAQRGPVPAPGGRSSEAEHVRIFFEELVASGLFKHVLFWRCEPPLEAGAGARLLPDRFVRARAYQPTHTLLIDLTQTEEAILASMREKTRYNIRLAERKGVTVRLAGTERDVEAFIRLNEETASRDAFVSQPSAYIRATYDFLHARGMADIRLAELDGEVLAASMEIAFGDTVTYLYGASSDAKRNVMAPYALHWSAIRRAKASGHALYDFHGVNPGDRESPAYKKSWEGMTRFKLGWGGRRVDYVGTWELPRKPLLYRFVRMFSR